jgi:hypothetical protein
LLAVVVIANEGVPPLVPLVAITPTEGAPPESVSTFTASAIALAAPVAVAVRGACEEVVADHAVTID